MAEPFATSADVEAVWGELTVAETAMVDAWLISASNNLRLIGRKRGIDVDKFILGDDVLTQAAKDAVVESVRRRLSNPKAIRQRSINQGAGPYSETSSETVDSSAASGLLYFTDNELIWLPFPPKNRMRTIHAKSGYYK